MCAAPKVLNLGGNALSINFALWSHTGYMMECLETQKCSATHTRAAVIADKFVILSISYVTNKVLLSDLRLSFCEETVLYNNTSSNLGSSLLGRLMCNKPQ